jgi:thiamine transport system substrate-binding protein
VNYWSEFEESGRIQVEVFKAGDGGEALTRAILSRESPLADVFFGVDNTFLSRALENDIFHRL